LVPVRWTRSSRSAPATGAYGAAGQLQPLGRRFFNNAAKRRREQPELPLPGIEQAGSTVVATDACRDIAALVGREFAVEKGADVRGRDDDELGRCCQHQPGATLRPATCLAS
jgi:hypothetical protein